jgi:hypothetical protein
VNKTEQAVIVISWDARTKTSKNHLSHQNQVMNVSVGFSMSHIESAFPQIKKTLKLRD